jgi:hypothetical protein
MSCSFSKYNKDAIAPVHLSTELKEIPEHRIIVSLKGRGKTCAAHKIEAAQPGDLNSMEQLDLGFCLGCYFNFWKDG